MASIVPVGAAALVFQRVRPSGICQTRSPSWKPQAAASVPPAESLSSCKTPAVLPAPWASVVSSRAGCAGCASHSWTRPSISPTPTRAPPLASATAATGVASATSSVVMRWSGPAERSTLPTRARAGDGGRAAGALLEGRREARRWAS